MSPESENCDSLLVDFVSVEDRRKLVIYLPRFSGAKQPFTSPNAPAGESETGYG
jgi:hypothetical protein